MKVGDLQSDVAWCLHEALERDLPDVHFPERAMKQFAGAPERMHPERFERPHHVGHPVSVYAWNQAWPSTALGMSGVGGQSMTVATTTVVVDEYTKVAAVYVSKHLRGLVVADYDWSETHLMPRKVIRGPVPLGIPYVKGES